MKRPLPPPKPPPKPEAEGTCLYLGADGEPRRGARSLRRRYVSAESEDGATGGSMGDCADPEAVASILLAGMVSRP